MSEAMRLFGENGYAATSVAQIEEAAGLRPGAGGLYAHFRSKEALLRAGLEALLTPEPDLPLPGQSAPVGQALPAAAPSQPTQTDEVSAPGTAESADRRTASPGPPTRPAGHAALVTELEDVVRAGLTRLRHDRDYNRILVRDLRALPDVLEMSADREIRPLHDRMEAYLGSSRFRLPVGVEPRALAAVLIGATANFWLLSDVFGSYPAGVTEERYVAALARLAAALIAPEETP